MEDEDIWNNNTKLHAEEAKKSIGLFIKERID